MKEILYKSTARKSLRKMPKNTAKQILTKIEQYATDPTALQNNVTQLVNSQAIRLRVGNYRIIMIDHKVIEVLDIGSRGNIYN